MSLSTVRKQTKYGLIVKDKPKVPIVSRKIVKSAFEDDDDEEGDNDDGFKDPRADIKRANAELLKKSQVTAKKIEEISNDEMYLYDEVYEETHKNNNQSKDTNVNTSETNTQKPKYLQNILAAAKVREIENDRAYERKLLREREQEERENEEVTDAPKFITTAYKKKLLEEKKWEYEDKLMDEVEKKTDVRGLGMQGFYSGLLTKNIAMGGDVQSNALSAYTAGSARQLHLVDGPSTIEINKSVHIDATTNATTSSHEQVASKKLKVDHEITKTTTNGNVVSHHQTTEEKYIVQSSSNSTSACNPVDKVLSARERFLARKRNVTELENSS